MPSLSKLSGVVFIKRLVRGGPKEAPASKEEVQAEDAVNGSVEQLMQIAFVEGAHARPQSEPKLVVAQLPAACPAAPPPLAEEKAETAPVPAAQIVETKEAISAETKAAEVDSPAYVPGSNPPLELKVYELEVNLAACSAILGKLSNTITPWEIKNNHRQVLEAKSQFDGSRAGLKQLINALLLESSYTKDAGPKLKEREALLELTRDQEAALQRTAQVCAGHSAKHRAMLTKIDQGKLARLESRGMAGGRFAATGSEELLNMLVTAVDVMVEEHSETLQMNSALEKSKAELAKRVKEVQDKMRNELEVRDRELQQLRATLKKATEDKEAGVTAAKEQVSSSMAKRTSELKALQHRAEVSKAEAEQAKAQAKALKAALDQATAAAAQNQEEAKAAAKKLLVVKSQKESAARELELTKAEQAMVFAELRQLQAAAAPAAAAKSPPAHLSKDASWPRVAFTSRGGKVLHSAAADCGLVDTGRCVTFQYNSAQELEAYVQEEGFVLCHTCRALPRF